jgi:hypothetical protein
MVVKSSGSKLLDGVEVNMEPGVVVPSSAVVDTGQGVVVGAMAVMLTVDSGGLDFVERTAGCSIVDDASVGASVKGSVGASIGTSKGAAVVASVGGIVSGAGTRNSEL